MDMANSYDEGMEEEEVVGEFEEKDFVDMCEEGEVEGVEEALRRGVGVNTRREGSLSTGLIQAVVWRREEVVALLLAQPGLEVNARSRSGTTALHWACESGSVGMVTRLLGCRGIDPDPRDWRGETPLLTALVEGREEVVRVMVGVEGVDLEYAWGWGVGGALLAREVQRRRSREEGLKRKSKNQRKKNKRKFKMMQQRMKSREEREEREV